MWNVKHVPHCPQNIWAVAVDQLWLFGWNQAFSPKRLQINKYRNIMSVSTRIAATYFFPFHLKLHGVKVVIFCLSLAKVTATSNPCKGTTTWLLLSSHSAKVSDNFFKCSAFITATSSPWLLVRKQRICPQSNLLPAWLVKYTKSPWEHRPCLILAWLLLLTFSQVCQISAAKGTNFLAKDFACNKPDSIANTSGSESLSISRVKASEYTDHSKLLKFWINVAILPGILFFLSIQKVLGIHWCLDSIWWKCRSQWCFLMSFQSKSTHCFKLLSAASKSCKGTTVPCQVAWSKFMRHRIDKKASTSSLHALAGRHTTLI